VDTRPCSSMRTLGSGDSASFYCRGNRWRPLLRDGLFDPGGIGLLPSLNIQGGFCSCSRDFNRWVLFHPRSFASRQFSGQWLLGYRRLGISPNHVLVFINHHAWFCTLGLINVFGFSPHHRDLGTLTGTTIVSGKVSRPL
jgi:hypothetical protein